MRRAAVVSSMYHDMASARPTRTMLQRATTWARSLDHCADMNGAPLTRTPPRRSWGRGPPPPGWRRIQARRLTCLLLRAVHRRQVESLVLGAPSSSPVHRALVLVLGTNIAVLLDCSKSSRQCNVLTCFLLTTLLWYEECNRVVNMKCQRMRAITVYSLGFLGHRRYTRCVTQTVRFGRPTVVRDPDGSVQ